MKTALDKAREKLDKVCEELDCFGFGYMEDAPLKFVLRGGENQENVAVFIMDDDAKFKACYNWTADNEPDYEKVNAIVKEYMIAFAIDFIASLIAKGEPPERNVNVKRIAEIW